MRRSDTDMVWAVILLFGGLTAVSWLSEQPRWLQILMLVSAVTASYGWWSLFQMPTTCNVANRTSPRGCKRNVKGLLRACSLVDHQARKRKLVWARLLRRPKPPSPYAPSTRPSRSSGPAAAAAGGPVVLQYQVEGVGYRAIMLMCTIVTTLVAVLTGTVTVVELLGGGPGVS